MAFNIIHNDTTMLRVDAIVNAANTDLAIGDGVRGAIFKAAGERELQAACDKLAPIKTDVYEINEVLFSYDQLLLGG
jgi:O-acetyl-ADP-ribose deacetylase (regulator of RNase III)